VSLVWSAVSGRIGSDRVGHRPELRSEKRRRKAERRADGPFFLCDLSLRLSSACIPTNVLPRLEHDLADRYTTRAFAPLMAKAAKLSIVEVSVGRAYCVETEGKSR
jgi:hypothetical protein